MVVEIQSESVKVQCLQEGAMLHSLVKDGVEYLWQGDPQYWAGQAPVCFPITGVLRNEKAVAFGKPCVMKRHGVARIHPFKIAETGANYVSFLQCSDTETKKAFPFDYALEIRYTVLKNSVITRYTVRNTGKDKLPFVIGGHPAFNCPLEAGKAFEDYSVEFCGAVDQKCLRPDVETGLIDISKRYDVLDTPVSPELLPPVDGKISQKTEDLVGPYELHDFFLYYMLRCGFPPAKIFRIAKSAFAGKYEEDVIRGWLKNFSRRFFTQQFKRSCLPDGPKVGSVAVSPRGDLRMPSDACSALWLAEAEAL